MKEKSLKRVLIMAGGTGGHVFPGLAVARYFREQGIDVHWLGTHQGIEARLVPEAKIPLHYISISGLRGKGIKPLLFAPFKITTALRQSYQVIKQVNPDIVIGMGGFVSGPGGIATWLARRPLIIHEQNAKAGFTNQLLARFAKKILQAFPSAFTAKANVLTIGNPVRMEIERLPLPKDRLAERSGRFHLLVLGGSLGAQALNETVPKALNLLTSNERPEVIHQVGEKHFAQAKKIYEEAGIDAKIVPFIKEMDAAYAWADMVLCRAGALTVSELCAAGLGAIFVPYPHAVDDHQTLNAYYMVQKNAAVCLAQAELTESRLANLLKEFAQSPEKRMSMAQAAYDLRQPNVVENIYSICEEICR